MEPLNDPLSLPPTHPGQQPSSHPTVMGLLAGEPSTAFEPALLEDANLREGNGDRGGLEGGDAHPIQGTLVGVEGEEGGRKVGLGDLLLVDDGDSGRREGEFLDANVRVGKDLTVVVGEGKEEGCPLPRAERESDLAGERIEVEGLPGREEEGSVEIRGRRGDPVAFSPSIAVNDGQRDVRGATGVMEVDAGITGGLLGQGGEGAAGGQVATEGLTDREVDEESEGEEEGSDRGREWRAQGEGERAADAHRRTMEPGPIDLHDPVEREM